MSEDFRARLRGLRREGPAARPPDFSQITDPSQHPDPSERAGPSELSEPPEPSLASEAEPPPAAASRPGLPPGLRARFERRASGEGAGRDGRSSPRAGAPDERPAGAELWPLSLEPPAELVEVRDAAGAFALRREELDAGHRHGGWSLDELAHADPRALELTTGDARLGALDLARAVFLDTETTGLAGGAGTTVFLVGLGWFEEGRFVLWQGFLRSPAEERALLAAVAERVGAASGLVSFFGKSFDRHRLEDKMRLHRVPPPFEGLPHLDLYHPLRRLYGAACADARLRTMEATLCGLARSGDLPGSRAPEAWFDFLAGRPHRLEGVFRHNAEDVLSLVTLAAHLGRVPSETRADGTPLPGCGLARAAALARLCLARRDLAGARRWHALHLARAAAAGCSEGAGARAARHGLAELLRHAGEDEEAERLHGEVVAGPPDPWTVRSLIALSKHAEHRRRDRLAARTLVEEACEVLERVAVGPERMRLARDLEARLVRLRRG